MVIELILFLILILYGPTLFISLRFLREEQDLYAFSLPFLVFIALIFCYVYIVSQPCTQCAIQLQYGNVLLSLSTLSFLVTEGLLLVMVKAGNYNEKTSLPKNNK